MNNKIVAALSRLNKILPLQKKQGELPKKLKQLHRDVLYAYVDIGRSLTKNEINERVDDIEAVIDIFKKNDLVVFDDQGEPIGAYPFTMEPREHKVSVNDHVVHCMCALDSLAVSPMFDKGVRINSACHITGDAISITQQGKAINIASEVGEVYFGINWNAAKENNCCADSLCTEMVFIKGGDATRNWRQGDELHRETFTLEEAVEFAAEFFVPLVQTR